MAVHTLRRIDIQKPFNLTRQFAIVSFICILLIAIVSAVMLSHLFTHRMLEHDAIISQDFLDSIITSDGTWKYFDGPDDAVNRQGLQEFFDHVAYLPDVVHANVYTVDRRVIWSTDDNLVGRSVDQNEGLDGALGGELRFQTGIVGDAARDGPWHTQLEEGLLGVRYIETYMPVWNDERFAVVGAVELYKLPRSLQESIAEGQRLIWLSALLGGGALFLTLYWVVRRANRVMHDQQNRLLETRSLSMIGETASAVAHAMRNPLASIRASAELTLIDDLAGARESAADIISEADRLDRWARELLQFSSARNEDPEPVDVNDLVKAVVHEHRGILDSASVNVELDLDGSLPTVMAHPAPLSQVLGNLIMNAVQAMDAAGRIRLTTGVDKRRSDVVICLQDNGPGLAPEIADRLFRPFATTKPTGTGLGLALSRRLLEHYGGRLTVRSEQGRGVTACMLLPGRRRRA